MFNGRNILVAYTDDEAPECLVRQFTERAGVLVVEASTVQEAEARAFFRRDRLSALIVDDVFPDGQGIDLTLKLRRAGLRMSIIGRIDPGGESLFSELKWFSELFFTKPVRFGVPLETLVAHLRIYESGDHAVFAVGPYSFRSTSRSLHHQVSGAITKLSEKEAALLKFLFRAQGEVVLRERLLVFRTIRRIHNLQPRFSLHATACLHHMIESEHWHYFGRNIIFGIPKKGVP